MNPAVSHDRQPRAALLATWALAGLGLTVAVLGCANSSTSAMVGDAAAHDAAGLGGGSGSLGGAGGRTAGTGGRSGSAGAIGSGAGGFLPTADAGADSASGDARPIPCSVQIKPVFPPSLLDLPFGPSARVRVHGLIGGASLPRPPVWRWTVNMLTNNQAVKVTPDAQDPSFMEFPLQSPGRYEVSVSISDDPSCGGQTTATAALVPNAWYWLRITPPSAQITVPPYEEALRLQAGQGLPQHVVTLVGGHPVSIDPFAVDPQSALHQAVTSYVLIGSTMHTWSREGDTQRAAFRTSLLDRDSGSGAEVKYDVLVVPRSLTGKLYAPLLLPHLTAGAVEAAQSVQVDPDVAITGHLTAASGPVVGATVALRAGGLPSTIGTSDAGGAFDLRARTGRFSAVILPPDGSLLPQARVDADPAGLADPGLGIDLPGAPGAATLSFVWRSDLATTSVTVAFTTSVGAMAAGLEVRLDSEPGALPDVGTLQVTGGGAGPQAFAATGGVHRATTTDAAGLASFAAVPRGLYRLVALPPVSSADGMTVFALDLGGASPVSMSAVALVPKVTVSGRLLGAPAGTRVLVLDDQPLLGRAVAPVTLEADGSFTLGLDAAHLYHLLTDPPAGRKISRVTLGPVETESAALALGDRTLPGMLSIAGLVVGPDGNPMSGARLQVYCMGAGPDCIDDSHLGAGEPLPLFETSTDASGSYALFVPDPASP